jgi:hypothetical protein
MLDSLEVEKILIKHPLRMVFYLAFQLAEQATQES